MINKNQLNVFFFIFPTMHITNHYVINCFLLHTYKKAKSKILFFIV